MPEPTLLVSTWTGGLFAVTSRGSTCEIASEPVRGLAPDGKGGALAIAGKHSLRRRSSAGEWTTVATSGFELACCMCVRDTLYVGTDDARLLRLVPGGGSLEPVEGFDAVPGRETWFAGSAIVNGQRLGPPLGIRSVSATADAGVLFANVHVGGIPRSTDGGRTWQPTLDINSDVHEVRAHPVDPDLVVAASSVGLCISRDKGATWTIERDGLHAAHCYAVAFSGGDILLSASADFFAGDGRIYRRPVVPDGFLAPIEAETPGWLRGFADTSCIAAEGSLIAIADRAGNMYVSDDFGRTWSLWTRGLPVPSAVLIC